MRFLFRVYQLGISPLFHLLGGAGAGCRFEPTCSHYAQESLRAHGVWRGGCLAIWRILRCHPLAKPGYDPVPHAICGTNRSH